MSNIDRPILAVDFDGTICEHAYPSIGPLKEGVVEALKELQKYYYILVYSCRSSFWFPEEFKYRDLVMAAMKGFLDEEGVPYDEIDDGTKGKPFAVYYIDDKAIHFDDNWGHISDFLTGRL